MRKPLNFIEWLNFKEEEIKMDSEIEKKFSTPNNQQLQKVANDIVAKDQEAFNKIKTSPSKRMAQDQIMKTVQKSYQKDINPNIQKNFTIDDIAQATANSLGFKNVMRDKI